MIYILTNTDPPKTIQRHKTHTDARAQVQGAAAPVERGLRADARPVALGLDLYVCWGKAVSVFLLLFCVCVLVLLVVVGLAGRRPTPWTDGRMHIHTRYVVSRIKPLSKPLRTAVPEPTKTATPKKATNWQAVHEVWETPLC